MSEIEVKALEWKAFYPDEPGGVITADDGAYIVNKEHMLGYWICRRLAKRIGNTFPTAEAAQAAAQADYDARIRSAIVERKVEPVAWLYEDFDKELSCYDQATAYPNDRSGGGFKYIPVYSTPPAAPVRAFDQIVAARKAHVDAVAAYNARLELVRAERERGNWHIKMDREYDVMSEAQSAFIRTVQELADAALSASPSPVDSREGLDWKAVERVCTVFAEKMGYVSFDQFMIDSKQRWLTAMRAALAAKKQETER